MFDKDVFSSCFSFGGVFPLRAGPCLHCLPESCSHDARTPALGCLLLPHDHYAGTGHTGRDTNTHTLRLWWITFGGIDVVSCKTYRPRVPLRHSVCEPGGPDDVGVWPVSSSDPTRPPQRAAAAVCLHRLLPARAGHGHAGKWMGCVDGVYVILRLICYGIMSFSVFRVHVCLHPM